MGAWCAREGGWICEGSDWVSWEDREIEERRSKGTNVGEVRRRGVGAGRRLVSWEWGRKVFWSVGEVEGVMVARREGGAERRRREGRKEVSLSSKTGADFEGGAESSHRCIEGTEESSPAKRVCGMRTRD